MVDFKFFSGSSNLPLAQKVAKNLGVPLGKVEIFRFSNGETRVRIEEDVENKTCFIFQSLSTPTDSSWAELLFFLDALKRRRAKKIIAVVPWLGYQKQDKQFRTGEAVSVAVVVKTFEAMGMDQIITFDLHSRLIVSYFKNPPVVLSAFPLFLEEIKKLTGKYKKDFVMVAPDDGAFWSSVLAEKLGIPLALVTKKRDKKTAVISPNLTIQGQVAGKIAVIVDDNVYTGRTLILNGNLLKKKGALKITCFATHPVFSGNAPSEIQNSEIDALTVSDTIFVPPEKKFPKLSIVSIEGILSKEIQEML